MVRRAGPDNVGCMPDANQLTAARDAATRFRAALEQGGLRLVSLRDFPHGACGDVSELLGQYLADSGLGTWSYASGIRSEPFWSHAWVERDGWLLDITADQFPDVAPPVLLTDDRTWHQRQFPGGAVRRPANLGWFSDDDRGVDALADYELLRWRADSLA